MRRLLAAAVLIVLVVAVFVAALFVMRASPIGRSHGLPPFMLTPSGGGGNPQPQPQTEWPIKRQAEFSYPERMQVNKAVTVRFSLFAEGDAANEPLQQAGALAPRYSITVPVLPDLKPYVLVKLDLTGAQITKELDQQVQPLYDTINTWRWEITAPDEQPVSMRPEIHVEYRDAAGQMQASYDLPWREVYTVSQVAGAGWQVDWVRENSLSLVELFLGLPTIVAAWRLRPKRQLGTKKLVTPAPPTISSN